MSRQGLTRATRLAAGAMRSSNVYRSSLHLVPAVSRIASSPSVMIARGVSSTASRANRITPEVKNPANEPAKLERTYVLAEPTISQYHELADNYLENLLEKLEEMQDDRGDLDVEFSAGVMNIKVPDKGTYVLNKQPPNKQIWLSSPVSGPKRYDYHLIAESQTNGDKAFGDWIYGRDNSSLTQLLADELGVDVSDVIE